MAARKKQPDLEYRVPFSVIQLAEQAYNEVTVNGAVDDPVVMYQYPVLWQTLFLLRSTAVPLEKLHQEIVALGGDENPEGPVQTDETGS